MTDLRRPLLRHRGLMLWLSLLVLAVRLLVPVGYMPDRDVSGITIRLCTGTSAAMTMPMPGMKHGGGGSRDPSAHTPCPFAAALLPALAGGDPVVTVAPSLHDARAAAVARYESIRVSRTRIVPPGRAPPFPG